MQTSAVARQTILAVDDAPSWGSLVADVLGQDYRVVQCCDGAEAEAAYARELPDWVWMDISMPGVNGFTAARAILARWPQARLVFVTQHNESSFRSEPEALGARGYVLKENLSEAVAWLEREACPTAAPLRKAWRSFFTRQFFLLNEFLYKPITKLCIQFRARRELANWLK